MVEAKSSTNVNKGTKMSKETFSERMARTGEAALYQGAGTELSKLVKKGFLELLADAGETDELQTAMRVVLESKWGDILVSGAIGMALPGLSFGSLVAAFWGGQAGGSDVGEGRG